MTSKEKVKYRSSKKWKDFRKNILEERDYRCEICGIQKKKGLQIHHLNPNTYGKETKDDVLVLCPADHKGLERLLRRTKNKVDIDEYCKNLKDAYYKSGGK